MRRILIIGSNGAGKSTLAKKLNEVSGLPIVHLDEHYWKPGWIRPSKLEWNKTVQDILKGEEWIMDGNYSSTLEMRIPAADTIVLLDFPRLVCLWRILKRRFKKNRPDCIVGCEEKIDFEFLVWVLWKFPHTNRKQILKTFVEIENEKNIHILKTDKDVAKFVDLL